MSAKYRNGTEAKVGDFVVFSSMENVGYVGWVIHLSNYPDRDPMLVLVSTGHEDTNLRFAVCPNDCVKVSDILPNEHKAF